MVTHAMAAPMDGSPLGERVKHLLARIARTAPAGETEAVDESQDELEPVLVGSRAWQRRVRYRADRDGAVYTIEGAIRGEYRTLDERKRRITQLTGTLQDALGLQWRPDIVSIADLEAALTFIPNGRAHHKARWVYALTVGREPVKLQRAGGGGLAESYKEAAPRTIVEAAHWLNLPVADARAGHATAEAFLVAFLCNEGVIE